MKTKLQQKARWLVTMLAGKGKAVKCTAVLTLLFTLGIGQMWGATATLTITRSDFSGSGGYGWYTWTVGDYSGQGYIYATTTTSMQFNGGKSGRTIFNSTPLPGRIVSIKMTKASGSDRAWVVRGGTTSNGAPTTSSTNTYGTAVGSSQTVGTKTWSTADGTDYRYFLLYENVTSASYISEIVVTYETSSSCSKSVTISAGASTNGTVSVGQTSLQTCSGTATDRQVTVSVVPNTCYEKPDAVSQSGTASATKKSGPTWNASTSKWDYVYEWAQNATGTTTFSVNLSTKTTYTVSYAKGDVPSGGGSINGSHANDTKTCGTNMALPAASFTTTGYTQTGWSKTNGGSQYAAVGGNYTDNAAQTFYPVWTANKYTVTWSVNGNTSTISPTTNVTYNTTTTAPTVSSPPCGVFRGWTTAANASYSDPSNPPSPLFTGTTPAITDNVTFYAVFADED